MTRHPATCHTATRSERRQALATLLVGALAVLSNATPGKARAAGEHTPFAASAEGAASVQLWHAAARNAIVAARPNQQAALRWLAYLAMAQHHAAEQLSAADPAATETAWAALFDRTSADTLAALVPAEAERWQRLADALAGARPAATPEVAQAVAIARGVARQAADRAAQDGFDAPWTDAPPAADEAWRSQLQPPRPPHLPALGRMRPLYLDRGDALRPPAPPAVGSSEFDAALVEVKGRAQAGNVEGLARARRWEMTSGSLVAGFWDDTAAELARRQGLSGRATARVLALALGATLDANIACHDAKYHYWVPRPSQADPAIRPLVALPNHPSYPSNHACDSGAAAGVLGALFPMQREPLAAMAREAGESRIDGGIHYRFDVEAGLVIGRGAADAALRAAGSGTTTAGLQP